MSGRSAPIELLLELKHSHQATAIGPRVLRMEKFFPVTSPSGTFCLTRNQPRLTTASVSDSREGGPETSVSSAIWSWGSLARSGLNQERATWTLAVVSTGLLYPLAEGWWRACHFFCREKDAIANVLHCCSSLVVERESNSVNITRLGADSQCSSPTLRHVLDAHCFCNLPHCQVFSHLIAPLLAISSEANASQGNDLDHADASVVSFDNVAGRVAPR